MVNKTILVIGGSGSWGRELTRQLLQKGVKKIIIFSRGEISQVNMEREFNSSLVEYVIGDVRDIKAVDMVFSKGIDYVIHLAALKHVPICENQPREAIYTNIIGVMNVIDAVIRFKIKKYIDVSTDKAAEPANTYGLTKSIAERLTIQANCQTKDSDFICIRSGNVLGTSGSVVPLIIRQIETKNEVTITNSEMTRFFYPLPQAISLLLFAVENGIGGAIYVINMPSFYLKDMIKILVNFYGNKDTKINEIGAREGEKIHEVLITQHEVIRTKKFGDYYAILPQLKIDRDYPLWQSADLPITGFSSLDNLKNELYLQDMLKKGGLLDGLDSGR